MYEGRLIEIEQLSRGVLLFLHRFVLEFFSQRSFSRLMRAMSAASPLLLNNSFILSLKNSARLECMASYASLMRLCMYWLRGFGTSNTSAKIVSDLRPRVVRKYGIHRCPNRL